MCICASLPRRRSACSLQGGQGQGQVRQGYVMPLQGLEGCDDRSPHYQHTVVAHVLCEEGLEEELVRLGYAVAEIRDH